MLWLFRFFSIFPLRMLHALGGAMGWLVWGLSKRYRSEFRANSAQAGLPFEAVRPAIAETGRFVAELPRLWLRPHDQSCLGNVQVEGHAFVVEAFARGRGVIFFGVHGGSFELAPQALAELYGPLTALYRPARKKWLARLESLTRSRPNLRVLPADVGGVRLMHRALKANEAVAMLVDQVPPEGLGLWAPFFGKPAYSMTLAARLALQTGAALLPCACERLPRGRGYRLTISPPLEEIGGTSEADQPSTRAGKAGLPQAVLQVNRAAERIVLKQQAQYLWAYARYKQPRREAPPAAASVAAQSSVGADTVLQTESESRPATRTQPESNR